MLVFPFFTQGYENNLMRLYIFGSIRDNKIIHMIPLKYDRKLLTGWKCTKDVFLLFVVTVPFFFITPDMLPITETQYRRQGNVV